MGKKKTRKQRTLKAPVRYSGIALHTGVRARLKLEPAAENTGIRVRRMDVEGQPEGPAHARQVTDVQRATTIACDTSFVTLVEHVLATLYGMGVDNAVIVLDGPEPPVADGSARAYVELVKSVGTVRQKADCRYCVIEEPIHVRCGDSQLIFMPTDEDIFRITCTVHYGVCRMDTQYLSLEITEDGFVEELSAARTFCEDYGQIEALMKTGLIRGASLDNAMVVCDGAIVCKDGLRYTNELVRHKMLDIVGDLSLVGRRLRGELIAIKPGHPLNITMAQKVVEIMSYDF